jgi:hypothetical protein
VDIDDLYRCLGQDRACVDRTTPGLHRKCGAHGRLAFRRRAVVADQMQQLAVETRGGTQARPAQQPGSLGDRVEDGLHVRRRVGDDFQDFGRRGLLLQQFVAFSGSFSEFALKFCDSLGIGCRVVQFLGHFALCRVLPRESRRQGLQKGHETPEAALEQPRVLPRPCPCCGSRMIIIETFARGCEPKHRPTPPPAAIRIDTS